MYNVEADIQAKERYLFIYLMDFFWGAKNIIFSPLAAVYQWG